MVSKSRCFASDSLEDVVYERVHDAHSSAGNSNIGMDLLENSVDESTVTFSPASSPLHNLCSSLTAFAAFLWALLRRTFLRTLSRRRLTTGTHLGRFDTMRLDVYTMMARNDASENCTPIYVLGLDRKVRNVRFYCFQETFDRHLDPDRNDYFFARFLNRTFLLFSESQFRSVFKNGARFFL